MWGVLKGKQLRGFDFHRQKPIDRYVVDFYCLELFLAIEIDGASHVGKGKYDEFRQRRLESLGVHFLRFTDSDVKTNLNAVVQVIGAWIDDYTGKIDE